MPFFNPETIQSALRFSTKAHQGQLIPSSNIPYILHPALVCMEVIASLEVESAVDNNLVIQFALLHDVVEDTTVTYEELAAEFGEAVARGVQALSKDKTLEKVNQLNDSLERIQRQPKEIWMVKLADRLVNLSPPPADWSKQKRARYRQDAILIQETLQDASPTLSSRLLEKIEAYKSYC